MSGERASALFQWVRRLEQGFPGYTFSPDGQGYKSGYARIFVAHPFPKCSLGPVQIGRVNLVWGGPLVGYEFSHAVHYKPRDLPYSKEDDFFHQLPAFLATGKRIPLEPLIHEAKRRKEEDLARKTAYRKANPLPPKILPDGTTLKKHRPRLHTSWNGIFLTLVAEATKSAIQESGLLAVSTQMAIADHGVQE